ncbi:MAG: tRNA modification GTPase MnmE [Porticoccaceae bacterium UBA1117]|nr:tRNA uridine-5-carboxymethylaminomethyl(34) synthesis GTPase MnmE [Porticoccaceae bacterium]CAI8281400.1 MAG: tRNA modification GTPase MnmE [Porticoccaceae bacterium UBA1117]
MLQNDKDTIVAIATATGRGGVGVVRLSGEDLDPYLQGIIGRAIIPRQASYCRFLDASSKAIDEGVALYFPAPHSFTGESVLELQGHGGMVILDSLVQRCVSLGARVARPGEFSERAFCNDKMDLAQAEAIADLIDASSVEAAKSAVRSMQGDFSKLINKLVEEMIQIRIYVEAAIDFPEEEIDFLQDEKLFANLSKLTRDIGSVLEKAKQGSLLKEGLTLVLAGRPNAGKSSLLNSLAGNDTAIVTPIAGTTRDVLREKIVLNGLPLNIVDTAGLRDTDNEIEAEGVRRAWKEIEAADQILFIVDSTQDGSQNVESVWPEFFDRYPTSKQQLTLVLNKIDISGISPGAVPGEKTAFAISAKEQTGFDALVEHLQESAGFLGHSEGLFSARRRHLVALEKALDLIVVGIAQLRNAGAGELLAEDLRQAQRELSEITGQFTSDDLLGRIFSSFCIGK